MDRVAKPALLAHLLEEARGHASAKRAGADLRCEIVGMAVRRRLEGEHDMGLLEGPASALHPTRIDGKARLGRSACVKRRKVALGML